MALQLGATRRAFTAAGVSDDLADKAAEELASYDRDIAAVRTDIAGFRSEVKAEFSDVKSDIKVLKWGQGVLFAMTLAILLKLFIH